MSIIIVMAVLYVFNTDLMVGSSPRCFNIHKGEGYDVLILNIFKFVPLFYLES